MRTAYDKMLIQAYGLYQRDWCKSHGYNFSDVIRSYLIGNKYHNEMFMSLTEFENTKFHDQEYVKFLLGEDYDSVIKKINIENRYPMLIGHCKNGNQHLRNIGLVANFLCRNCDAGKVTVTFEDGKPFLTMTGTKLRSIIDTEYGKELLQIFRKLRKKHMEITNPKYYHQINLDLLKPRCEVPNMDRNSIARIKNHYKPGMRLELERMDDQYAPVPPGTRGTVTYVDDEGSIGMKWDNGRTLSIIPGLDTFRKLTPEEVETENQELSEDADEDESPVQTM